MLGAYTQDLKHKEDELALQYLPAVKAMAYRLKERLPSSIDFMDLSAIATEELIKLARRYDKLLNDSFWGYAKKRVYGAMLDYLRSLDIVSRASRKLIKAIDYAIEEYMLLNECEPTDEELSDILNESIDKIKSEFEGKNFSIFKDKLSELLADKIDPIGKKIKDLLKDEKYLDQILENGAKKADNLASKKINKIKQNFISNKFIFQPDTAENIIKNFYKKK